MQEKCQFCGGTVEKKTVSLDLWRKEKLYVFKKSKSDETMVVPVMSLKKFTDEAEAVS